MTKRRPPVVTGASVEQIEQDIARGHSFTFIAARRGVPLMHVAAVAVALDAINNEPDHAHRGTP